MDRESYGYGWAWLNTFKDQRCPRHSPVHDGESDVISQFLDKEMMGLLAQLMQEGRWNVFRSMAVKGMESVDTVSAGSLCTNTKDLFIFRFAKSLYVYLYLELLLIISPFIFQLCFVHPLQDVALHQSLELLMEKRRKFLGGFGGMLRALPPTRRKIS